MIAAQADRVREATAAAEATAVAEATPDETPANLKATGAYLDATMRGAFAASWAFVLEPTGNGRTRLIERFRLDWNPSLVNSIAYRAFLEPASFVMERKMLLGIKQRAEALAARSP